MIAVLLIAVLAVYLVNPLGSATLDPRSRLVGYVPYRIPSEAMAPTLLPGDFILVKTSAYSSGNPGRGEIIAFRYPVDPTVTFVSRVVGVAGDRVRLAGSLLYVNGEELAEPLP